MGMSEKAREAKRERARRRYREKHEEILAKQRKYHQEHKEERNAKQRERDRKRREEKKAKQKENSPASEEQIAKRKEQQRAQREKKKETEKNNKKLAKPTKINKSRTHKKWMPIEGWEERYLAEEIGKYGPIMEDGQTRSQEELEKLRLRIFAALDGKVEEAEVVE